MGLIYLYIRILKVPDLNLGRYIRCSHPRIS